MKRWCNPGKRPLTEGEESCLPSRAPLLIALVVAGAGFLFLQPAPQQGMLPFVAFDVSSAYPETGVVAHAEPGLLGIPKAPTGPSLGPTGDIVGLSPGTRWWAAGFLALAVAFWLLAACVLAYCVPVLARRLWHSEKAQDDHEVVKKEREDRAKVVKDWSEAYAKLAIVIVLIETITLAALVIAATFDWWLLDVRWRDLVTPLYLVRIPLWIAPVLFVLWVWLRPSLIERVFKPREENLAVEATHASHNTIIALSGGGIRSAAYSLGALEALEMDEATWPRVSEIVSVSGGAYAAGAWECTRQASARKAKQANAEKKEQANPNGMGVAPEVVKRVRRNSTYLAPGVSGKVRAFNLWGSGALVTLSLYAASVFVVGTVLGVVAASVQPSQVFTDKSVELLANPSWPAVAIIAFCGVTITVLSHLFEDAQAEAWQRCGEILGWITAILAFLVFVIPGFLWAVEAMVAWSPPVSGSVALTVAVALTGAAVWTLVKRASAPVAMFFASLIVPLATIVGLAWSARRAATGLQPDLEWIVLALVVLAVIASLDATKVSLHPFYRRRLSKAFDVRNGQPTKLAPNENPLATYCAAANVTGARVTSPGLDALSFTLSAYMIGLPLADDEPGREATGEVLARKAWHETDTVMAAVAMSGAAVAPCMGRYTHRWYQALLALANIRLGVWVPNPLAGANGPKHRPRMGIRFYKELLGLHTILDRFLYVTDGGHWDELGLVEALRSQPALLLCFDSTRDESGSLRGLGRAKSLAEIELDCHIEFDTQELAALARYSAVDPSDDRHGDAHAHPLDEPSKTFIVGSVDYPQSPERSTTLVYCRPVVTADCPIDIKAFRERSPDFPHHPTFRQLFDDETFEAYRALGHHAAMSILESPSRRLVATMPRAAVGPPAPPGGAASSVEQAPAGQISPAGHG